MTYNDPSRNTNSTELEIDKQLISQFIVDKLLSWMNKPYPLDELMLMTAAVCRFKPQLILEWGTNVGNSARIFYEIVEAFDIKAQIHSIDLPDDVIHSEHNSEYVGSEIKHISKINLHRGDGITKSLEIIQNNPTNGNILFFVDGDHQYQSVKQELEKIINIPNAVVLLHDTLYQSPDSGYYVGPFNAIKDVLHGKDYKWLIYSLGGPGMSLVYNSHNLSRK
jgi:cephalosporin hydroxylase